MNKPSSRQLCTLFNLILVFATCSLFLTDAPLTHGILTSLERLSYDLQLRQTYKHLPKQEVSIALVDIDDKSIQSVGRWPWPRKKMADLVARLHDLGAAVIAFDITFSEAENNLVEEVMSAIKKPDLLAELEKIKPNFDYDDLFAKSLKKSDSVLSFVLSNQEIEQGDAPPSFFTLTPELAQQLAIPAKKSYINNVPVLSQAAKSEGFINASPDPDGVLRFSPLLMRHNETLYGSLALQAAKTYLMTQEIGLVTASYSGIPVLEGIQFDQMVIPTDPHGNILIPFRGPPFSFPYISAIDLIEGKTAKRAVEGKLIFIGSTAAALGDVRATAMAPIFPGLEVQATIAMGILEGYFPYKPTWGKGIILLLILIPGLLCSLLLPRLGPFGISLLTLSLAAFILFGNRWLWIHAGIVLFVLLPLLLLALLFILNLLYGYFSEKNRRQELKAIFGHYVPESYLDAMLQKGGNFGLEGESKELTVLFTDINQFTNISEKLTATQIKELLNYYFTPLTEIIFKNQGTIDKYVGDMIMAFWGAPLADSRHSNHAILAALKMQQSIKELGTLQPDFAKQKSIEIKFGVGINTGIMNVGDMGSEFRKAYTVLGDSVNLASRLESLTRLYHVDILVGEATWQETKDDFIFKKLDKIKVKGKSQPLEIYTPLGTKELINEKMRMELEKHHAALNCYFHQEWPLATKLFQELSLVWPEHAQLYALYLERIAEFEKTPPEPHWDGSYALTKK